MADNRKLWAWINGEYHNTRLSCMDPSGVVCMNLVPFSRVWHAVQVPCRPRRKIQPKGGAKDCYLGWSVGLGVRLSVPRPKKARVGMPRLKVAAWIN